MNIRIKILKKLAQISQQTKAPSGSPNKVNFLDFPSAANAWGSNNLDIIQNIINIINITMFTLTDAKLDFYKMKQQNFNVDSSQYHDINKHIIDFAKEFYNKILTNNGSSFLSALSPEDKVRKITEIKNSSNFVSIPDGGINSILPTKINGSFKSLILNLLNNVK